PANAVDANCRSSPGTPKGKDRADSLRKTFASDRGPARETRADNLVFESARFFNVAALQQLRRSAQLSQLQRRFDLPSTHGPFELSPLRTYRCGPKEMSGV